MEKPTTFIQKIINNLNLINNIENGYTLLEKDIILHNLREAYTYFLAISTQENDNKAALHLQNYNNNPETEAELANLKSQIDVLKEEKSTLIEQYNTKIQELTQKWEAENMQVIALTQKQTDITAQLKEKSFAVVALQTQLQEKELQIDRLIQANDHNIAKIEELEKQLANSPQVQVENNTSSEKTPQAETSSIENLDIFNDIDDLIEAPISEETKTEIEGKDLLIEQEKAPSPYVEFTIEERKTPLKNSTEATTTASSETLTKEVTAAPIPSQTEKNITEPQVEISPVVKNEQKDTTSSSKNTPSDDSLNLFSSIDSATPPFAKQQTLFDTESAPAKTEKKSLNDLLSGNRGEDHSLGARFQNTRVKDLTKAISINDKFLFIRELFRNRGEEFSSSIQKLNACTTIDEAFELIESLKMHYAWDTTAHAYLTLCDLVRRKFID